MKKRNKNYIQYICFTVFIIVTILFLPYKVVAQNQDNSSLPTIISFSTKHRVSNEENGKKMSWIDFSWEIENATKVRLYKSGIEIKSRSQLVNGEFGWPLSMKGGFSSQYKKPAIYELVAENNIGKKSKKIRINKKKERTSTISMQPKILTFKVEPRNVKSGGQVSFYWQVKNAYRVRLYDSFGEITSRIKLPNGKFGWPLKMKAAFKVNLRKSNTYRLVVTGRNGNVSKSVAVNVLSPPVIKDFSASRSSIRRGLKTVLSWRVNSATQVTLNGKPVLAIGKRTVSPSRDKKYTLEAQAGGLKVKKNYVVIVTPFRAPKLSKPITSLELCKKVISSRGYYKCISPDGPFSSKDKIKAIIRLSNLSKGKHRLKRITSSYNGKKWKKIHEEESSFPNSKNGYMELNFEAVNLGKGIKKLTLILDGNKNSKSEISYCIDCPKVWNQ